MKTNLNRGKLHSPVPTEQNHLGAQGGAMAGLTGVKVFLATSAYNELSESSLHRITPASSLQKDRWVAVMACSVAPRQRLVPGREKAEAASAETRTKGRGPVQAAN